MGILNFFQRNINKEKHIIDYHDNGKIKYEGRVYNNKKNGFWKRYYDNGNLESEGVFVNDKENNLWKYYYENGILHKEVHYEDGLKRGMLKVYHINGNLKAKGLFEDNKFINGEYYDENGVIIEYVNNPNGLNRVFRDGYQEFHKNNGLFNGEMKVYNKYGVLIQHIENLIQKEGIVGVLVDGKETQWYDNGSLKIVLNYKNGLKEGYVVSYLEKVEGIIDSIKLYENNEDISLRSIEDQKMILTEIYNYMKSGVVFHPRCYIAKCELLGYKGSRNNLMDEPEEIIKNILSL